MRRGSGGEQGAHEQARCTQRGIKEAACMHLGAQVGRGRALGLREQLHYSGGGGLRGRCGLTRELLSL